MNEETPIKPSPPVPPPDIPPVVPASVPPPVPDAPPPPPAEGPVRVRIREGGGEDADPHANSPAPFNTRVLAALIDLAVTAGLTVAALLILPDFAERVAGLVGAAYLVVRDSLPFLGGQSVGKTAMKLKVVTSEGKDLLENWQVALIRNAILAIPLFPLVELFVLLSRENTADRGLRLGDVWAKTRVIAAPVAKPPAEGADS